MSQAAFVGAYENICAYSLVGFKTVEVKSKSEAQAAINTLLAEDTAIIFVDDDFYGNFCEALSDRSVPVVSIPFSRKSESRGIARLREKVSKAAGSEMLFGKE